MIRRVFVFAAVLLACHNEDSKSERDTKGRSDPTPARATVAEAVPVAPVEDLTVHRVPIGSRPAVGGKLPLVTIDGRKIVGAQDDAAFSRVLDAQLADAKRRVANGTPQAKIYDEIMTAAQ